MSFRKVGGVQYSATQNVVKSRYNTSDSLYVTQNVGQPNTYITFDSDISGNIIIYGDLDVSGNLHVLGDIDCSGNENIDGNLHVLGDIDCSGNENIDGDLYVSGDIDCSGNENIDGNLHVLGDIDCSGNENIDGNLHVLGDIDCSGNLYINNLYIIDDAYINDVRVGKGAGNVVTNTVVGNTALSSNTNGDYNTAVGYYALSNNTSGLYNTAVGSNALKNSLTALNCVAVGNGALVISTGDSNTAVGSASLLYNTSGNDNVAIGNYSMQFNNLGNYNTAVGSGSLNSNNTGNNNVSIGYRSGFDLSGNSNYNTLLGYNTNVNSSSNIYNFSTAIGANSIIDASNQMVFGTVNEKIYIPGTYVQIGGTYTYDANYALYVDGSANFTGEVRAPSFYTTSDYRIKENVISLDEKYSVDTLRPVTYINNKTQKTDIGLIAHELQEVYPFLVTGEKDGEDLQSVNYTGLIGILIKEIQDLKKEVKILKDTINEFKK